MELLVANHKGRLEKEKIATGYRLVFTYPNGDYVAGSGRCIEEAMVDLLFNEMLNITSDIIAYMEQCDESKYVYQYVENYADRKTAV